MEQKIYWGSVRKTGFKYFGEMLNWCQWDMQINYAVRLRNKDWNIEGHSRKGIEIWESLVYRSVML